MKYTLIFLNRHVASRSLHSGLQGLHLSLKFYHMYIFPYKCPKSITVFLREKKREHHIFV